MMVVVMVIGEKGRCLGSLGKRKEGKRVKKKNVGIFRALSVLLPKPLHLSIQGNLDESRDVRGFSGR